jgi:hypothetical protein
LRCNFVVAAPKGPHSSVFARLASGAFYEIIGPVSLPEIVKKAIISEVPEKFGAATSEVIWKITI